jgi:hypothetical protein
MIVATWKTTGLFKADAQKVAQELTAMGDEIAPSEIVDKARDEQTELHKCFEWRDDIAAEKYRIYQARQLMCNLVVVEQEKKDTQEPVRLMFKTREGEGYKPLPVILSKPDEYQALLARAKEELRRFKEKYKMLKELKDIFELIP